MKTIVDIDPRKIRRRLMVRWAFASKPLDRAGDPGGRGQAWAHRAGRRLCDAGRHSLGVRNQGGGARPAGPPGGEDAQKPTD